MYSMTLANANLLSSINSDDIVAPYALYETRSFGSLPSSANPTKVISAADLVPFIRMKIE